MADTFLVDFAAATAFDLDLGAGALLFSGLAATALGFVVLLTGLAAAFGAALGLAVGFAAALVTVTFAGAVGLVAFALAAAFAGFDFALLFGFSSPKADAQFWTYLSVAPLLKIVTA